MLTIDQRKAINTALLQICDAACVALYAENEPRKHLGASVIGEDCAAKQWYSFRWVKRRSSDDGRVQRLFQTGHLYEARFVEWLTACGFEMFPFDDNGQQFKITSAEGHFGGSMDGGAIHRGLNIQVLASVLGQEKAEALAQALEPIRNKHIIVEFKTHNKKNFALLKKNGVKLSYYKHHVQYSTYGTFYNIEDALYVGYCKDNDEIHFELNAVDRSLASDMEAKATEIIVAQTVPAKISSSPTYYECGYCSYKGICHFDEPMEKNCRSCRHAQAGTNKTWVCTYWNNKIIPNDFIPIGCDYWAQVGS